MPTLVIRRADLRRETFRAGGKGGQHQNKTETAVRWTHIPTGTAAESRTERSQDTNSRDALRLLISKLQGQIDARRRAEAKQSYQDKPRAVFGSQIRSYVLDRDRRVVDHRTGIVADPNVVLRGRIDALLEAEILHRGRTA